MQKKAVVLWCYAAILWIGGLIGYITAGSQISLAIASLLALYLSLCGWGLYKDNATAYWMARIGVAAVFFFFGYRFWLTYQPAPAGIMAFLSSWLLYYLSCGAQVRTGKRPFIPSTKGDAGGTHL